MKMRKKTGGMFGRKDDGMMMGKEYTGRKKKSAKSKPKRGGY